MAKGQTNEAEQQDGNYLLSIHLTVDIRLAAIIIILLLGLICVTATQVARQGPKGEPGPMGYPGIRGEPGECKVTNGNGAVGVQGPIGVPGEKGPPGYVPKWKPETEL
jgi:hypothetical protein